MKRFVLYLAIVALFFCVAFAPQPTTAQDNTNKAFKYYTDAVKLLTIYGDTTSAHHLSTKALAEDSTYMPAAYILSRIERDPQRALEYAERAVKGDSTNQHLLEELADKSLKAKQYQRATQVLQTLIKDSHEPEHFRLLAILHTIAQNREAAIAVIDSAEVRLGKIDFFSRMRQQMQLDNGDTAGALKSALALVEQAPYDIDNQLSLAEVYATIGADSLAEVTYNKAIEIDKSNSSAWYTYAGFLDSRKRYTEMLLVWRNIIELESVSLPAKLSILESITSKRDFYRKNFLLVEPIISRLYQLYPTNGQVIDSYIAHLIAGNRVEEAATMLKQRIVDKTPTAEDIFRIIEIENYLNHYDIVEQYVDKGLELFPTQKNLWGYKSWLQSRKDDNEGAIKTLNAAMQYAEDDATRSSYWGNIGDLYYELGNDKLSKKAYKKALKLDPNNSSVLNNYAYHLSVEGKQLDMALEMAIKATTISANNATFLDTLAWVYYKLGEYEQAKKVMQQAMSFDKSNSSELALHYGDILDALGSTFMAQTYWRKALERGADATIIEGRLKAQKERLNTQKGGK